MIIDEKRERPGLIPVILVFCLGLALSIGFELMLNDSFVDKPEYLATIQAVFALIIIGLTVVLLSSERLVIFTRLPSLFSIHRIAVSFCIISFIISTVYVSIKSSSPIPGNGGLGFGTFELALGFFIMLFIINLLIRRPGHPLTILFISIAGYSALTFYCLRSFPLTGEDGTPFSLFYSAIDWILAGFDPFHVYDSVHKRPFTYLPGHWLSYFPSKFLDFDPRWISGTATIASALFVYLAAPKKRKHMASYCLSLYLLTPYLFTGQSHYTGLLPFAMGLMAFLFARQYYLLGSVVLGLRMTMSLFPWLLIPFILVFLFKERPINFWGACVFIIGMVCALVLVPFQIKSPGLFFYCTFEYWLEFYSWNGFNVSAWLVPLIGGTGLYFLQFFFFVVLFYHFIKSDKSLAACYSNTTLYSLFFITLNRITGTHLFPIIILLAIIGLIFSDDYETTQPLIKYHRTPAGKSGVVDSNCNQ